MEQEPPTDAVLLEKAAYTARRIHEYLSRSAGVPMENSLATAVGQAKQSLTDLLVQLEEEKSQT